MDNGRLYIIIWSSIREVCYECIGVRIIRTMATVRRLNGFKSRISVMLGVVTITGLVLWNTELPSEYIRNIF